ncbi:NAD(P)H-binding protein [Amycolatopsis anabasis]|uniref:NAD(P)H-binding protein n=1 Tax=Amycolatopsis anabasis TaxID=1840409 RepID=UPI0031B57518
MRGERPGRGDLDVGHPRPEPHHPAPGRHALAHHRDAGGRCGPAGRGERERVPLRRGRAAGAGGLQTAARPVAAQYVRGHAGDEARVTGSGLNWTIVCPPRLNSGPRTRRIRSRVGANVRGSYRLGRADLADFLLRAAADDVLARATVSVAAA